MYVSDTKKNDPNRDTKDVLRLKQIVDLVADSCEYHKYEVEDVLTAFYAVMKEQLYKGNALVFEKLFRIEVIKPQPRRMYNMQTKRIKMSPAHPKLVLTPSIGLLDYIRQTPDTLLKVKKGIPSTRFQHHTGKLKEYFNESAEPTEEFPNPS